MTQAYSYHTFIFPFLWSGKQTKTRNDFEACLHKSWNKTVAYGEETDAKIVEAYNQYRYFNVAARNAIYSEGREEDAVWNYEFNLDREPSKLWRNANPDAEYRAKYVVEKYGETLFSLVIDKIRLKLFNSGIGILIFDMENHELDTIDDFNKINDMARHIYRPFISNEDGFCSNSPDKISIVYPDVVLCEGRLDEKPTSAYEMKLAAPILYLLGGGDCPVTANKKEAERGGYRYIEPVLDERMFVAAYYVNAPFVDACTKWEKGEYQYIRSCIDMSPDDKENLAATLYRTIYVDGSSFTTCQNRTMMKELLERVIYKRWVEMGSITGITDYSMICVTNCGDDYLLRNFRTEYVEMVILVLAQRTSLRRYENMISDDTLKGRISDIHENYIDFQSQLLLNEVTSQQQGVELYELMRKNLFVAEQVEEVDKHLEALFKQKSSGNESRENLILFIIAVLAIVDPMNTFSSWLGDAAGWIKIGIFAVLTAFATGFYLHKRK